MFVWKLAAQVSADDVVVNLADPGFVKGTALAREVPAVGRAALAAFAALCARSKSVGPSAYIDALVLKGKESHGSFLMSWKVQP
jgi:hypothetical protein